MPRLIEWSLRIGVLIATAGVGWSGELQRSYALVVGIDDYSGPWPPLHNARSDAADVALHPEGLGFRVRRLYNGEATKAAILDRELARFAQEVKASDRVLIFFAGHGHTQRDAAAERGFLVPLDGGEDLSSLISMDELEAASNRIRARHQVIIADACYSGVRNGQLAMPSVEVSIDERARRPARQVITAGTEGQEVVDTGSEGHSLFTGMLLAGLAGRADSDGDGIVTASELVKFLRLCASTPNQTPTLGSFEGHGGGDFLFGTPPKRQEPADPSYLAACIDRNLPARVQPCDINGDGVVNVADVQPLIEQALGTMGCRNDLTGLRNCTVVDVQRVINAAQGSKCVVGNIPAAAKPKQ